MSFHGHVLPRMPTLFVSDRFVIVRWSKSVTTGAANVLGFESNHRGSGLAASLLLPKMKALSGQRDKTFWSSHSTFNTLRNGGYLATRQQEGPHNGLEGTRRLTHTFPSPRRHKSGRNELLPSPCRTRPRWLFHQSPKPIPHPFPSVHR